MSLCPNHGDRNQSLSITYKNGRILLYCFAGCDTPAVLRGIDMRYKDLFSEDKPDLIVVDRYPYVDEKGELLFYTLRYLPKTFKQCHPSPNGEMIWNLEGVRRPLYHLPDVTRAVEWGHTIIVCEGEKDVNNLWLKAVRPATCNPLGAGKWLAEHTQTLAGAREVIIIPDRDQAGYNHARNIAEALYDKVTSLKILLMPAPYKNFSEWMESIPKWDNQGRRDYDGEAIPVEFDKLVRLLRLIPLNIVFPRCKALFP